MARKRSGGTEAALGGCLGILIVLATALAVGGLALEYDIETWARVIGHPVNVPFNVATVILGTLLAEVTIPVAIITLLLAGIGLV